MDVNVAYQFGVNHTLNSSRGRPGDADEFSVG